MTIIQFILVRKNLTAKTTVPNPFSAFSDEMIEFVDQNNNLYPPSFLSTETDLDIGKGFPPFS